MSFQAMAWAVKQKVGNATGKAILLMLANYADEGGRCFPSQETLANECECSKRSILDWLQKFEDMGLLRRERRHGAGGYRRADVLTLNLGAAFSPENNSRENPSKPKCSTFTAEPITEPINTSLECASHDFDEFWALYPNKVGKRAAEKAFAAARKRISQADLIAGLVAYVNKRDDRHWCNPATWLNQDRWADQPAQAVARGSPARARPMTAAELNRQRSMQRHYEHDDAGQERPDRLALGFLPQLSVR